MREGRSPRTLLNGRKIVFEPFHTDTTRGYRFRVPVLLDRLLPGGANTVASPNGINGALHPRSGRQDRGVIAQKADATTKIATMASAFVLPTG